MSRIESPALQLEESRNAASRIHDAEERLIDATVRFRQHALNRLEKDPGKFPVTLEEKARIRDALRRRVELSI